MRRLRRRTPSRAKRWRRRARRAARLSSRTCEALERQAPRRLGDVAGRQGHRGDGRATGRALEPDDIVIDGGNSFYKDDIRARQAACSRKGHPLCRLRHVRRRLGHRPRLLHDDRRPEGGGGSSRSDLRGARAGARRYSAHAGPRRKAIPAPSAATSMPARPAPVTSSRWCTTASSTD